MQGVVKWFDNNKGFGFVLGDDGQEYFLHASKLPEFAEPKENDRVEFVPQTTIKGRQAFDAELI